jgi:esterase/lipase superfamily enzyme/outer membrane protein OmpA-like peptidoglycan-associated protein
MRSLIACLVASVLLGCASPPAAPPQPAPVAVPEPPPEPVPAPVAAVAPPPAPDPVPAPGGFGLAPIDIEEWMEQRHPLDVYFEPGSAVIGPLQEEALAASIELLKKSYVWELTIEGHTDETGDEHYNLALADRRANVVKDYLRAHGVTIPIRTISLGEERPFREEQTTEYARAQNRRAHLVVTRSNLTASTTTAGNFSRITDREFTVVRVHFATDRRRLADSSAEGIAFGGAIDPALTYGWCTVSIPKDHRLGEWEQPDWKDRGGEDQKEHVVYLWGEAMGEDQFFTAVRGRVRPSTGPRIDLLLFIHGYNVSFVDAMTRTALLAYDLKPLGPAVAYSWPSHADAEEYPADEENNLTTVAHLERFLRDLSARSGAKRIGIVAHSMGNRALIQALGRIQGSHRERQLDNIEEIVFAAPDVFRPLFTQNMPAAAALAKRLTLYASAEDLALKLSRRFHDKTVLRAGELGPKRTGIYLHAGLASVDATAVRTDFLGHSYYGDNSSVITDIRELLLYRAEPQDRPCLSQRSSWWVFDRCARR